MTKENIFKDGDVIRCQEYIKDKNTILYFTILTSDEDSSNLAFNNLCDRLSDMNKEIKNNGSCESFSRVEGIKYNKPIEAFILIEVVETILTQTIKKFLNKPLDTYFAVAKIDFDNHKLIGKRMTTKEFADYAGCQTIDVEAFIPHN